MPTYEKFDDFLTLPKEETETTEPIIKVDNDSVIVESEDVTEDQYFDDFFGE